MSPCSTLALSDERAYCDCTGSSPWPLMTRLHAGISNRYYLCRECGAVREDVYQDGVIAERRWHDAPDGTLPQSVRKRCRRGNLGSSWRFYDRWEAFWDACWVGRPLLGPVVNLT